MSPATVEDIQHMTEEELATVKKEAVRNIAKFIALKVGIAVAIHVGVNALVKKLESKNNEES